MSADKKTDVVLLGHGSRAPGAEQDMQRVAAALADSSPYHAVHVCHMSLQSPGVPEVLARCASEGVERVIVIPYFLHLGVHMREDIPTLLAECAAQFPSLKVQIGAHLGFDSHLVELVRKRVQNCVDSNTDLQPDKTAC